MKENILDFSFRFFYTSRITISFSLVRTQIMNSQTCPTSTSTYQRVFLQVSEQDAATEGKENTVCPHCDRDFVKKCQQQGLVLSNCAQCATHFQPVWEKRHPGYRAKSKVEQYKCRMCSCD